MWLGGYDVLFALYDCVKQVISTDYSEQSITYGKGNCDCAIIERRVNDVMNEEDRNTELCEHVDLACSFQVIEHIRDVERFIHNSLYYVKPGGYYTIVTPNRHRVSNLIRRCLCMGERVCDPMHYKEYLPGELRNIFTKAGLEFIGLFGHCTMSFKNNTSRTISRTAGWLVPGIADSIGMVGRKPV